jgi:hypothetical protein
MWLHEHRHNFTVGLLEKSKLAQHAYVGHKVSCADARILEIGSNSKRGNTRDWFI